MNTASVLKLIVAVFFLLILPVPGYALTPVQVFDKVKDSIVVVKALDAQGKVKMQGSGVLLPSGKIATNCHVVEGGASYQVGRGKQFVQATLYAGDGDKDICLLDVTGITGEPAQFGKTTNLKVGVPVYAVGAPQGLELSLSDGIVSQLRGGPPPVIQTTAAISPGSSGGGLFDGEGRLVGLTTLYMKGGQSLNFAIPVEWIGEVKPGRKQNVYAHLSSLSDKDFKVFVDRNFNSLRGIGYAESNGKFRRMMDYSEDDADSVIALLDQFKKTHAPAPAPTPASISATAEDWYNKASALRRDGKYTDPQKAIEYLSEAIRLKPDYADAYHRRGFAYALLGQYQRALTDYDKTIHLKPDSSYAYRSRGIAYGNLKQYQSAIRDFDEAIRLKPDYEMAYNNRGFAYILSGNNLEGCSSLSRACELGSCEKYNYWKKRGYCQSIRPEQSQPTSENTKPSVDVDQRYREIKGIVLMNGNVIEGQILSINPKTVEIRTIEGKLMSYSFEREVQRFIKE